MALGARRCGCRQCPAMRTASATACRRSLEKRALAGERQSRWLTGLWGLASARHAASPSEVGWLKCACLRRLYKGLTPLWGRQIPYTMMKFGEPSRRITLAGPLQPLAVAHRDGA